MHAKKERTNLKPGLLTRYFKGMKQNFTILLVVCFQFRLMAKLK